jgi:hypothetical protein
MHRLMQGLLIAFGFQFCAAFAFCRGSGDSIHSMLRFLGRSHLPKGSPSILSGAFRMLPHRQHLLGYHKFTSI